MKLADFQIGGFFRCGGKLWICTDKGTRTVAAICADDHPDEWRDGPPYTVQEIVFDEYDFEACSPQQ